MRFLGGIDRGAQLVGAPVQWVEQDVGTGAVELLNEAPGCVIDDRPLTCLADALEHGGDEVGLPRSGSADQQDMLRLDGVGHGDAADRKGALLLPPKRAANLGDRSAEHTSELQSLMRISYAVFCLKNKKIPLRTNITHTNSI